MRISRLFLPLLGIFSGLGFIYFLGWGFLDLRVASRVTNLDVLQVLQIGAKQDLQECASRHGDVKMEISGLVSIPKSKMKFTEWAQPAWEP